jgi:endonuclease/exonuclease/phosphatase family metal-dependent hydrolase
MEELACTQLSPQAFLDGEWTAAAPAAASAATSLQLVTWNTWFSGHMFEERTAALLDELARRHPDVIALQEVTEPLLKALRDAPWVQRSYQLSELEVRSYDVVILSRHPIRRLTTLELPTSMSRRLLVAELACGLCVATVHLESTAGFAQSRAEQLAIIQPYLARDPDVVLVGDMNFQPGAAVEEAALDPSFVDVWPRLRPADPGYTVDTAVNTMRLMADSRAIQKRIDRVFLRSPRWRASAIDLLGTTPLPHDEAFISDPSIDLLGTTPLPHDETFISDHFGLAVRLDHFEAV